MGWRFPVVEYLGCNKSIKTGGHNVGNHKQIVTRLLYGCEDTSQSTNKQKEDGHGRQLTCIFVLEIFISLNQLQNKKYSDFKKKNRFIFYIKKILNKHF